VPNGAETVLSGVGIPSRPKIQTGQGRVGGGGGGQDTAHIWKSLEGHEEPTGRESEVGRRGTRIGARGKRTERGGMIGHTSVNRERNERIYIEDQNGFWTGIYPGRGTTYVRESNCKKGKPKIKEGQTHGWSGPMATMKKKKDPFTNF